MNWYTTKDVADTFGVKVRTVERWREKGTFVPERRTKGGHSRYSKKQIGFKLLKILSR
jgi:DNA-binding transcriptional MerR regulator